ncbi:MAG: hypothetical protein HS107_04105 [Thermoflexaceae bacterium]|nr:hypothetical protein [Thermoflexaceae bacterium]
MADRQLDLFGEAVADLPDIAAPRELPEEGDPLLSHHVTLVVAHDDSRPIGDDSPLQVEPYRFSLTDPQGRWIITAAHEDEVKRGKATRRMVGRCSCGWVSGFRLYPYGSTGPDLLVAHLRSHELETRPPAWRVDAERNGWRRVRLLAGRVHCASGNCHRLGPAPGKRRPEVGQEYRLAAGFGEPCPGHGGALHDRVYHWEEHDPEDHSGEPKQSHAVGLLDPDGTFWHYWCAPLEGRGLFGFVRDDETRLNLCTLVTPGTQTTHPAAAVRSQMGKELQP